MGTPKIRAVAFDCFGTLLRISAPTNPWRHLLAEVRRQPGARTLDLRREFIATIEEVAEAGGVAFRPGSSPSFGFISFHDCHNPRG